MPTWTSTFGMKLTSVAFSHPGSSLLTQNHLLCWFTSGAKVKLLGSPLRKGGEWSFTSKFSFRQHNLFTVLLQGTKEIVLMSN